MVRDLAEAREEATQALGEIDALRQELAAAEVTKEKREAYKEAVNKLEATNRFERGQYLTFPGNYPEALRAYDRAVVLRPYDAKAYSNRGAIYVQLGNYERAVKDLDRAVALNPKNRTSLYNSEIVYKKLQGTKPVKIPQGDILRKYDEQIQLRDKGRK